MRIPDWLRWILVIPAAIGAYAASQVVIGLLSLVSDFFWSTGSARWTQLMNSAAGPAAFVWYGSRVAPRYRFSTSICLAVLLSMAVTAFVTFFFSRGLGTKWENVWFVICAVVEIISSIVACHSIQKADANEKKEHPTQEEFARLSAMLREMDAKRRRAFREATEFKPGELTPEEEEIVKREGLNALNYIPQKALQKPGSPPGVRSDDA